MRCLVRIGYAGKAGSLTIPEMSRAEGVSPAYAAKILRVLRKGGFVKAERGKEGGYTLARPPESIVIADVIGALGGRLFESKFCDSHSGQAPICTRSVDCSVRSLWARRADCRRPGARQSHSARPLTERRRDELLGAHHPRPLAPGPRPLAPAPAPGPWPRPPAPSPRLRSRDANQPGRPGVWFHQPDGAVGIVPFQFLVFLRAQVQGPDNRGAVNFGGIMHPLRNTCCGP